MASAGELWARVQPYVERLAVWQGYEQELQTLAIYGIGVAIYTALVFAFYQNLSRRKPFHLPTSDRPGWQGRMSRMSERAVVFPLTSFVYFAVLASALFFLSKPEVSTLLVLRIAMAVVVAVRVTVYMSESMSNDLAKLVPLGLLGVLLVDPSYLALKDVWPRFAEATHMGPLLGRYFLLFIALEAVFSSVRWMVLRAHERTLGKREAKPVTLEILDGPAEAPQAKTP